MALLAAALVAVARPAPGRADGCDPIVPPAPTASLTLDRAATRLEAGGQATLRADVRLSARPRPVDVFFVLDASRSTQGSIDSLRRSIRQAAAILAESGIDLRAGAAIFGDLGRNPYQRLTPVRTVDCDLDAALAGIETDPVGAVEAHLIALNQALTGSGYAERDVPPGQDAGFRARADRFLVHATDEGIDERYTDGASYVDVVGAFRTRDVAHVGVLVYRDPSSSPNAAFERTQARDDLDRLGRDTGTTAPGQGLDCTGEGAPDVAPGQPVTCEFGGPAGAEIGTIVSQVVATLAPPRSARVEVVATAAPPLAVGVENGTRTVDPEQPSQVDSTVQVACPADATGETYEVTVTSTVDGETVASAALPVTCGSPPTPPAEPDAPQAVAAPGPEAAAAPPAPPAPIAPAPAPAPAVAQAQAPAQATSSITQAVPAQSANLAPVVGIVPQEQASHQVAGQQAERRPLLSSDRRLGPSPVTAWAGALLLTGMAVAGSASRSHQQASARSPRPARRRRR